jgi:hypothetical protein
MVFALLLAFLVWLAFSDFNRPNSALKVVAAALGLIGVVAVQAIALVGLLLKRSVDERTLSISHAAEARLTLESERNAVLAAETERRLRIEAKQEREDKAKERRSDAKVVLDRYRGPLLDAAWQLGDRLDNIRNRSFFAYLSDNSGRAEDAKLTTLFRIANYLGWREYIRREVQLLRFENEKDTKLVAGLLNDVAWALSSDKLDGNWAMLWVDEQRGIGELMTDPSGTSKFFVRGHAAFRSEYDSIFEMWMERLASDLFTRTALTSNRLRFLQWALYGLVRQLDEEGAYGTRWMDRSAAEIHERATEGRMTEDEKQLTEHLSGINSR